MRKELAITRKKSLLRVHYLVVTRTDLVITRKDFVIVSELSSYYELIISLFREKISLLLVTYLDLMIKFK